MKNICSREVKIKEAKIQEIAKELDVAKKENSSSAIEMYKASNEKQAQVTIWPNLNLFLGREGGIAICDPTVSSLTTYCLQFLIVHGTKF